MKFQTISTAQNWELRKMMDLCGVLLFSKSENDCSVYFNHQPKFYLWEPCAFFQTHAYVTLIASDMVSSL